MLNGASTTPVSGSGPLLYLEELLHRVGNEYAGAISLASVMASRASTDEAKMALQTVIKHLAQRAKVHQVLLPPTADGTADLGDYLARLCQAKAAADLEARGTALRLDVVSAVTLDHAHCWRVGLIVSELITNAARHGSPSGRGEILISLGANAGRVVCRVSDNGAAPAAVTLGLGTHLVDALAAELGGHVERRFGGDGGTVTLTFPAQSLRYAHWPKSSPRSATAQPVGRVPHHRQPSAKFATPARRRRMRTAIRPRGF